MDDYYGGGQEPVAGGEVSDPNGDLNNYEMNNDST
jgi:hypothetical protein